MNVPSIEVIHDAAKTLGLPIMLKSRLGAYDGRGNSVLKNTSDESIATALSDLGVDVKKAKKGEKLDLYAEGWINFHSEVAVMVVRSSTGETSAYPAVTAIQTDSICRVVLAPARDVHSSVREKCESIATRAIDSLGKGASGVFGVELFLVENNGKMDVLLNEIAPRPHNTGHYTQDACAVSQFENHVRAVCGLPLGTTSLSVGAAASEYICCIFNKHSIICHDCASYIVYETSWRANISGKCTGRQIWNSGGYHERIKCSTFNA